jgi:hypothetical protein
MKTNGQSYGLTPFPFSILFHRSHNDMKPMKIVTPFCVVCIVCLSNLCFAQQYGAPAITNWGRSVKDIRLAINITNGVIEAGSLTAVATVIHNASTNAISLISEGPAVDFDFVLTNGAGKLYQLSPQFVAGSTMKLTLSPGEDLPVKAPVSFGTNIEAGDYVLKATRFFWSVKNDKFELESNLIKVRVK